MKRKEKDETYFFEIITECKINYAATKNLNTLYAKFEDTNFHFNEPVKVNTEGLSISFLRCSFSGEKIDLTIRELPDYQNSIVFTDCEIQTDVSISDSKLKYLIFNNSNVQNFHLIHCEIYQLFIEGDSNNYNKFNSLILFRNTITNFDCRLNDFAGTQFDHCIFETMFELSKNNFNYLNINDCNFKLNFTFLNNSIEDNITVMNSHFGQIQAKGSNFGLKSLFKNCNFLDISNFSYLKSNKSTVKFENCIFKNSCYFNNSIILSLEFNSVIFQNVTSFQGLNCSLDIKFNTSYFEKIGFFENIKIGNKNSLDLNTIRIIKGQLSKSESKIEYLKFNALEQKEHFKKLKKNSPDYYILLLNSWSNDFGRNWIKGLKFTIKTSAIFFLALITLNSFIASNYPLRFKLNSNFVDFSTILSEYLKFTLSLGFNNEEIQSNGFLYLIFIISKIFIGFGIYQTISAFRKFGKI